MTVNRTGHRKVEEREARTYSWSPTDHRDRTRSKMAVRRIAAQKEGEDMQTPATFREERGHLRYEPLHKRRTGQSGSGTKEREAVEGSQNTGTGNSRPIGTIRETASKRVEGKDKHRHGDGTIER
ncbi:hypothetical protein NDU88_000812 [Pleurodeles waltl]|uniref:Uncharacterized protein n=1 Tax=Pleurodeles waltl TaxID=8319 RepID=A0AAV7P597_PLEWA|nr:hypothetical protein NDU88_000812 [Pleurodeles waltl]